MGTSDARSRDELRRVARKIESEVDQKLASYSRLGSSFGSDVNPQEAQLKARELEDLLRELGELNLSMAESAPGGDSQVLSHTLARHREILHEYEKEFRRTRVAVTTSIEQAELLGSRRGDTGYATSGALEMDQQALLLRERSSIYSATSQADAVIMQAQAASSTLTQQRGLLTDSMGKMAQLGARFPIVNNLLSAIRRKKSRDGLILSAVVAVCTLLLLTYWVFK